MAEPATVIGGALPIRAYRRIPDEPHRQPGALPHELPREGTTFTPAEPTR